MIAPEDVAIQRGGPPRPPPPASASTGTSRAAGARGPARTAPSARAGTASPADAFDDGARLGPAPEAPPRARAPAPAGRSPALVQQSLDRLEREIREREGELGRLVALIAREGFAREVAARHHKTLAALRKRLAEARARATKARRALGEIERGAEKVPSSRLGRIEGELTELEGEADEGRRSLAALRLAAELAADEPVRRVAVRSADKARALAYAESESPSTLLADVAAGFVDAAAQRRAAGPGGEAATSAPSNDSLPGEETAGDRDALGKPLTGQQRLGALVRGGRR